MTLDLETGYFKDDHYGVGRVVSMLDRRGRETLDTEDAERAVIQFAGCDLRRELWVYLGNLTPETVN